MDARAAAFHVVKTLSHKGYTAYFAGGWVRDHLLGLRSPDVDVATDASPEEVLKLFPNTIEVGISFGVVRVIFEGLQVEVASFRKDGLYVDGRHPESIERASPEEDAQRRDFTINGMFYDPIKEQVLDFVGGQEDLRNKIIRAIGNPQHRFDEDRLRVIRAVRFASRLGFSIEGKTREAMKNFSSSLFPAVAKERIWQELCKMIADGRVKTVILEMYRLGILQSLFPDLKDYSEKEVELLVEPFPLFPLTTPPILFVAELFPNVSLEKLEEIGEFYKISKKEARWLELLFEARQLLKEKERDPFNWAHFYAKPGSQLCLQILSLRLPEKIREAFSKRHLEAQFVLSSHIRRIQEGKPLVTSQLLMGQGIRPGVVLGKLLLEAEGLAIRKNLEDPEEILEKLRGTRLWNEALREAAEG